MLWERLTSLGLLENLILLSILAKRRLIKCAKAEVLPFPVGKRMTARAHPAQTGKTSDVSNFLQYLHKLVLFAVNAANRIQRILRAASQRDRDSRLLQVLARKTLRFLLSTIRAND